MKAFAFKHVDDYFECGVSIGNIFILDISEDVSLQLQEGIEARLDTNEDTQLEVFDLPSNLSTVAELEAYVKELENYGEDSDEDSDE